MTVIHILMAPQYLNNNHVLRNNVSQHSIICVYAEQWYVITSDVSWTHILTNKLPEPESKLVVHSSKICKIPDRPVENCESEYETG